MKTVIVYVDKQSKEIFCQILEYETEEQKKWLEEDNIYKEEIIYKQDIEAFCYLQLRKELNV